MKFQNIIKNITKKLQDFIGDLKTRINFTQLEKFFLGLVPVLFIGFLLFYPSKDYSNHRASFISQIENPETFKTESKKNIAKLSTKILVKGEGTRVSKNGDAIQVNYRGWLAINETIFDQSFENGRTPFEFTLGKGGVIKGWDKGLIGMKKNEVRRIYIPSDLGYGKKGSGESIPKNADLIFDVELVNFLN